MIKQVRNLRSKTNRGPEGGWRVGRRAGSWGWSGRDTLWSRRQPLDDSQLVHLLVDAGTSVRAASELRIHFWRKAQAIDELAMHLERVAADSPRYVGWATPPVGTTHFTLELSRPEEWREILGREVCQSLAKCHPLASIPDWTSIRPPFPIERVVLPPALEALAERCTGLDVRLLDAPASLSKLAREAIGALCIIDPDWVRTLKLRLTDLESIARGACLVIDLATFARLLPGRAEAELVNVRSHAAIPAARNEYADWLTRGLALRDSFAYGTRSNGHFHTRWIRTSRPWRTGAAEHDYADILQSLTLDGRGDGAILCAARAFEHGELIATDLPWLAAGMFGMPLAPGMLAHLLQMLCGGALPAGVQFACNGTDIRTTIRDMADLTRRFPPLQPVRWARPDAVEIGLHLPAAGSAQAHLLVRSGRVNGPEALIAPELMMIAMKALAAEQRQRTAWAQSHLQQTQITWTATAREGLKYAVLFDAARPTPPTRVVDLADYPQIARAASGLMGDGSIQQARDALSVLRKLIESQSRA